MTRRCVMGLIGVAGGSAIGFLLGYLADGWVLAAAGNYAGAAVGGWLGGRSA